jgi:hypothetical protein
MQLPSPPSPGRIGEAFLAGSAVATGRLLIGTPLRPIPSLLLLVTALLGIVVVTLVPGMRTGVRRGTVVVLGAPLLVLAVAVAPHGSHDLWSYAMYGRMVSHYHASPYRHIPAEYPLDPLRHLVSWTHTKSVYGPVFTALSTVLMTAAGASTLLARLAFQGTAALALVAIVAMLWRRDVSPVGLALLVLNPVVIIGIVNGGHNDLLVGGLALAAVFRLQQQRPVVAGALLATAGLIKVSALLAAAAALVWAWRRWERRAVVAMAATMAAMVVGAYAAAGGLVAVVPLTSAASRWSHASVWQLVSKVAPQLALSSVPFLVIAAVVLAVARRWRVDPSPSLVMGAALLAYLLAAPYVMPWYLGWALPLLAIRWDSVLARVAFLYAALLFVAYSYGSARGLLGFPLRWSGLGTQLFEIAAIVLLTVSTRRGPRLSHPSVTMRLWSTTPQPSSSSPS